MKIYFICLISLLAILLGACSKQAPSNSSSPVNAADNQTATSNPSALSPTDTLRALSEASNKHDPEGIKRFLSEGTLKLLDDSAKKQNKPVDEILRAEDGPPFLELPEMRNETVNGETATVEIKGKDMTDFETLPFVRENGMWKVAIDKYVADLDSSADDDESGTPEPKKTGKKK
jgi:hypothetical protein